MTTLRTSFRALSLFSMLAAMTACEATPPPAAPATTTATTTKPAVTMAAPALDPLAQGRACTQALYGHGDLWARLGPPARELVGNDPAGLAAFQAKVEHDLGSERALVSEHVETAGDTTVYRRVAHFAKTAMTVEVVFGFDAEGKVVAFGARPVGKPEAAATTKLDYVTKTTLRVPFDGTWTVAWGGRTLEENHHAVARDQRFAYDLYVVENGHSHRGDGRKNEDYFAYGRPILAPAKGRVVGVVDGVTDNVPGVMPTDAPAGNHVVIDHGNGEYSLLAHLVPGSIGVRIGDAVKPGQVLGACGNSGHSSEPHLHYHLQNASAFAGDAEGLPAPFNGYVADGKPVRRGEPVRGQLIAPKQ